MGNYSTYPRALAFQRPGVTSNGGYGLHSPNGTWPSAATSDTVQIYSGDTYLGWMTEKSIDDGSADSYFHVVQSDWGEPPATLNDTGFITHWGSMN